MKKALIGQLSTDKIAELKELNKRIYAVEVGGHVAYFREPTRKDINASASQLDQDSPMDYFETIMRDTIIGGSDAVITDDALYLGALNQVRKKIEGEKAVLVNL